MPTGQDRPTLLIITGPQGSGNHLFSKIFALHPDVLGWSALLDTHWLGHKDEPFQKLWLNTDNINDFDWSQSKYFVTSISTPYVLDKQHAVPKYKEFITKAKAHANIIVGIIGRDKTILKYQQARVRRGDHTTPQAVEEFSKLSDLADTFYLSQELFYLYGKDYLKNICKITNFPIDYNSEHITSIMNNEANEKYIQQSEEGPFDEIQGKINY
tara:strand:+ start:1700 stop:2338 length:639 start_codon:yes stop_codon:yes gene_type:complete